MPEGEKGRCRLCLVTPADIDLVKFAPVLDGALAGGDVASIIITCAPASLQAAAEILSPIAQARGTASLVHNDTRIAGRAKADGVHIDSGIADLKSAVSAFRPKKIVGAGGVKSRHEAMESGEADPDYLFFGRLNGDTEDVIFANELDLAGWWSSMFFIPAVVMGGRSLQSVREAAQAGVEFVALNRAIWEYPGGPGAAVAEANRLLGAIAAEPGG